ncbi:MAG TPA: hypothetical protein ENK25_09495 [Bacteroidetes bacterium]|nr:hypothetical protein [Bacteroidota bacterium]
MNCLKNYSLYHEYYKQHNYNDALPFWKLVYKGNCLETLAKDPKYRKYARYTLQHGATIYEHFLGKALNARDTKKADSYLDTLMSVYDKRMAILPEDSARVLSYKGIKLFKYKKDDPSILNRAYNYLNKSIQMDQHKSKAPVLAAFMNITVSLYKDNVLTGEDVVNNYSMLSQIIERKLNETPDDKEVQAVKDNISAMFTNSGAATCESLISLFSPKFEENKNNPDVLKKYIFWLKNTGCEDADLYLESLIALNNIEPKSSIAYDIAQIYKKRGNFNTAIDYLKNAIQLESDNTIKSKFYIEIADITFRIKNNLPEAKKYCKLAIQANPKSGLPHILLGRIYANAKNYGEDELAHQAVFWVAVDQFNIAKRKDPSLTNMANEFINTFSKHFPPNETVFFYGFKEGDTYELKGWINEKTKVRIRK